MSEPGDVPDLRRSIEAALMYAVQGNYPAAIEFVGNIAGWGIRGVFTAIYGWAAVALKGLTGEDRPDPSAFYSLEVSSTETGEVVDLGGTALPAARQQAAQLVTLYANGDRDTVMVIVEGAWRADYGTALMMESLRFAATVTKGLLETGPASLS